MRVAAWVAGLVAVAALASAGAVYATHRPSPAGAGLAASRQPAGSPFVADTIDPQVDPPHVIPPPSPSPSTAPPSGGTTTVTVRRPAVVIVSRQQALINQDRAAYGLGPLTWSGCLYNVALSNARRIAAQESLSHTNGPQLDLGCRLGYRAGENIGWWSAGINDVEINNLFMKSAEHRANILGPYHYVATAWVVGSDGRGYIAVEFG
jgi:uncharacterized protein YkwD